jgi:hypothetical protein
MRAYGKCVPNGVWAVCVCAAIRLTASAGDLQLEYNRDVRPILADNCFACHGPDSAARQADLRLDRRATAVDMGAIVPGEPEESELLRRIRSEDSAERMPPPETKKQLTIQQQQTLEQWIASGAEYQPHWSLITPVRPDLPDVGKADWARNALDQFILARLEAAGLTPAPPADPWTVVRRVSLDLTGLPPDPDLVEQFTADALRESGLARPPVQPGSPSEAYRFDKAYEALVDKLLQSLQWGEHRGRYWLDVARYADTHGIHFDNYREVWAYRDWVINAFNRNLPFDQFTIEQLAGDLLPNATLDQQIASGFNRCNITTNEGGAISE